MYTFEQLPAELNYYINDFVIEQTIRENFKKVISQFKKQYKINKNRQYLGFLSYFNLKKTKLYYIIINNNIDFFDRFYHINEIKTYYDFNYYFCYI